MDTWDAYRSRRNIREYTDRPIDDTLLDRIIDAGRRAPSAFNSQPWDFVVVTGHPALDDLATAHGRSARLQYGIVGSFSA